MDLYESSIKDEEATLSGTFQSFFDVYSSSSAQIAVDMINYSWSARQRRATLQHYWGVSDGAANMVTVYTKDTKDGEPATCEMTSVRDRPRYPQSPCTMLSMQDNALLGYVTNHVVKLGFYMNKFPPPYITADVVFVPAPETTNDREPQLLTVCISDESIGLVRPTDSSCFSHSLLLQSQSIIKRGKVRRIGAGTVFVFVKVKDLTERPTTEIIWSTSGERFTLDSKLAKRIKRLYGMIPANLVRLTKVFRYGDGKEESMPLPFEGYAREMIEGNKRQLMDNILVGVFSSAFEPTQIERMCVALGSYMNRRSEQGLGIIDIARELGFTQV